MFCFPSSIGCMSYPKRNALASFPFFFLLFFLLWSHKGKLVCKVEGRGEWGRHSRFIRGDFGIRDNVMQTRILKCRKKLERYPAQEEHKGNKSKAKWVSSTPTKGRDMDKRPLHLLTGGTMSVQLRTTSIKEWDMKVTYLNFHPALSNVDFNVHSLLWKLRWLIK